jgi:hypothetical protein
MNPSPKKDNKMKKTAQKKAPFVCPVVYADRTTCPWGCADLKTCIEEHNSGKSNYLFHPKYHSPKPKPKAKKPSRKATGWGVVRVADLSFLGIYGTRRVARNMALRARLFESKTATTGERTPYRVSRIGEL